MPADVRPLFEAATRSSAPKRNALVLAFLQVLGLRVHELALLDVAQIDLGAGVLRRVHGKGGTVNDFPLPGPLVLDEWLRGAREMLTFGRECERVFRRTTNGERRRLLSGVMLNHVVTNRRTAPTLRFPYSLLEELPPILRGPSSTGLNRLPEVEKVLECETTASSQGEIERGCSTWSG